MHPVAVQRQRMPGDFGLVALIGLHVAVEVAVGQTQGRISVQLTIGADGDAVAVGVITGNAAALVLVGIAAQGLQPDTLVSRRIAVARAAGALVDHPRHQRLAVGRGMQYAAADIRAEGLGHVRELRIGAGVGECLEYRILLIETRHQTGESPDGFCRVATATGIKGVFRHDILRLGADQRLDIVTFDAKGFYIQQRGGRHHGQIFSTDQIARADQRVTIARSCRAEIAGARLQLQVSTRCDLGSAGDRQNRPVDVGVIADRHRDIRLGFLHVQIADDRRVRLHQGQRGLLNGHVTGLDHRAIEVDLTIDRHP